MYIEETHATRLDGWIIWKAEERAPSGGEFDYLFLLFVLSCQIVESFFVKGNSYPESCAQRNAEGGGSPMFVVEGEASTGFLCLVSLHTP